MVICLSNLATLDLSFNKFSIITSSNSSIVSHFPKLYSLNLASCNLQKFPNLQNHSTLMNVDLSDNKIQGEIPNWIWEVGNEALSYLNLSHNNLTSLQEPYGNFLEGKIPQSLVNCRMLHVLNLGNNMINDTYPCSLGNNTNLHVLVLRSNRFHGSVHCGEGRHNWSNLHILDIAHNNFNGVVPPEFFSQWRAMTTVDNRTSTKQLSYIVSQGFYYQDTVTVTVKGFELNWLKS
ncbi:receptor like protein 48 [Artemisia annua]|uniref:Receptor like protein 48 n=1 Tax=Artemisia annua TaxID=35608 RepID=A0A2U1Q203_ARTAN|nr:receptor like protein 48 [Artemisia annua]